MDNIRPRTSSFSPSKRFSTTRTPHRPQRPKKIMKSIWVKKESTVGSQAVLTQNVSVKRSAMINSKQTWRPKGAYLDSVNRDNGSYTLKQFEYGNPEEDLKDYAIIDSGCSRSMTGDKDKLSDFKEFKGGYVAFGNDPKGGRITGKGTIKTSCIDFEKVSYVEELKFNLLSVSQICDKKHNVLFTDKECLILSPKFKFVDEDLVILRAPRKNDVYSLDLKNIIPSGGVTCLVAKATKDEAVLWHRRLGHVNFKNINKLVKGNLVRGLPSKTFKLDHSCLACRKGKQHRASCKKIEERTVREPLELLHMDLFGPVSVESVNRKKYCLVVTDDCSKFSWVFFLAYKDETYDMLHDLIVGLENKLRHKVKTISSKYHSEEHTADKEVPLSSDEQALHDELVNLMHQESLAKLHNDAQRNAFEKEKKRIALEKGKDTAGILTRRKLKESASDQHQALLSFIYKQNRTNHKDQQSQPFAYFLTQENPRKSLSSVSNESWVEACKKTASISSYKNVWVIIQEEGFVLTSGVWTEGQHIGSHSDLQTRLVYNELHQCMTSTHGGAASTGAQRETIWWASSRSEPTLQHISLAAEEAHSESTHSRAETTPRDAQGTPSQSAAQASISTAQGTADTQGTAQAQGTDEVQDPFFEDIVDKDAAVTPDLERKSDETEEINIEEKKVSDVQSGDTEELDLETFQSTARRSAITPRTLNDCKMKHRDLVEENPKKKKLTLQQIRALETTNDEEVARKIQAEWDAEEERKRLEELKKAKPKTTSLAQERNQMMNFLKGQGYKNLQKLKYPQMKELYDKVQESIKRLLQIYIPFDFKKERGINKLRTKTVDEIRNYLRIVDFEKSAQDKESLEGISMITELQVIDSPDGEYLIIHRANNHFRAFDTFVILQLFGDSLNNEDDFLKNQESRKPKRWRLNESSGVHTLELEDGTMIHMLAERRYPVSEMLMDNDAGSWNWRS
ncbi:putative ribonuclease H-like domain-containing protein [Tanacetum coccineum]|uniref:Ribonuclease H-like domain-containing protein n=1 Tax=Tanacetum coccineum TaxID=301880 RepID=A0ABQ5HYG1_9ASTR